MKKRKKYLTATVAFGVMESDAEETIEMHNAFPDVVLWENELDIVTTYAISRELHRLPDDEIIIMKNTKKQRDEISEYL